MKYLWDENYHLFRRANGDDFAYSDGIEVEDRLLAIVSKANDRSTLSTELAENITDWPSEYHLSASRHCLVRPLSLHAGDKVLELGCGCGAITRFLGEVGADVVAVEGSIGRARIAAERCRELSNVRVVADDLLRFETDERFDCVLLVGVLEYAAVFSDQENPFEHYLRSVTRFLAPAGRLVIAIENKLGLKYFNGCSEDHVGVPFFGVQALYSARTPRTFGRQELIAQIAAAGLPHTYFYYPFPDYKLPLMVLSQDGLSDGEFDPVDLLARCQARDYHGSPYRGFDDALAFSALHDNGLIAEFSNSFLVVAQAQPAEERNRRDLAFAFSVRRAPEFCAQTRFARCGSEIQVLKEPLVSRDPQQYVVTESMKIRNHLAESPYRPGRQLFWNLLRARAKIGDLEAIVQALSPWVEFLLRHARVPASSINEASGGLSPLASYTLPGEFVDCTPFNLLDTGYGLVTIDVEWERDGDIPMGWVVTRGVLWSLTYGVPSANRLHSILEVIVALCERLGLVVSTLEITSWLEQEAAFQAVVTGRPCKDITTQRTSSGLRSFVNEIASLSQTVATQSEQVANLNQKVARQDEQIVGLIQAAATQDEQIVGLIQTVATRDEEITSLGEAVATQDEQIVGLIQTVATRDEQIASLGEVVATRDEQIATRDEQITSSRNRVEELQQKLREANTKLSSFSWRLTAPLRTINIAFPRTAGVLRAGTKLIYWALTLQLLSRLRQRKVARMLLVSGLFDPEFYLAQNQDVADSGTNPLLHYLSSGAAEGRKPNLYFDTAFYLRQNPDVAASRINPLLHYLVDGFKEGREPGPEFSGNLYLEQNPDVRASGMNPLSHFLKREKAEGRPVPRRTPVNPEVPKGWANTNDSVLLDPQPIACSVLPPQAHSHGAQRRLICISHVLPYPPRAGNEYRIHRMLTWLAKSGFEIFLVICPLPDDQIATERLMKACCVYSNLVLCERRGTLFYRLAGYNSAMEGLSGVKPRKFGNLRGNDKDDLSLSQRLGPLLQAFCPDLLLEVVLHLDSVLQPDIFLLEYVFMTRAVPFVRAEALKVVDTHDVFSTKRDKVVRFGVEDSLAMTAEEEASLLGRCDLVIGIQSDETEELRRLVPNTPVVTAGVDFDPIEQIGDISKNPVVLVVGSDNPLNVKGLKDFLRFAWPLVSREVPGAELRVVGSVGKQVEVDDPSVKNMGLVDDLPAAYAEAWVVVNPAVAGTGLKVKTIEAICHLRPLVAWPSGVEGLDNEVRALCRVATDWYDFARQTIDLCKSEDAARALVNKRNQIREQFSADTVYRELATALQSVHAGSK